MKNANELKGRWTVAHGEDYFFNQLQSGFGDFQSYLHSIGKVRSPDCVFCNGVADDVEHTFSSCEWWNGFRQWLYGDTGELSPDNIVKEKLKSTGSWYHIGHYVRALLITKKIELDRPRDRMARGSLNHQLPSSPPAGERDSLT